MDDEYNALLHNHTWCLVPPSPNSNIVGHKWLFRVKYNADGSLSCHKARLVAQGFSQWLGINVDVPGKAKRISDQVWAPTSWDEVKEGGRGRPTRHARVGAHSVEPSGHPHLA